MSKLDNKVALKEREANEFAFELLLPYELLKGELNGVSLFDDEQITRVAKKYQVTVPMLMFRIGQLTERRGNK